MPNVNEQETIELEKVRAKLEEVLKHLHAASHLVDEIWQNQRHPYDEWMNEFLNGTPETVALFNEQFKLFGASIYQQLVIVKHFVQSFQYRVSDKQVEAAPDTSPFNDDPAISDPQHLATVAEAFINLGKKLSEEAPNA